jgi:type I restriction enzyme, S subunit
MKLETFFEKFEMFADAPNAVAKMRELILESAIRGKLVPRNVTDEPASELLKRIASVQAGQVRKQAVLPPVGDDSYLQIPSGWVWTRLGNTGRIFNGDSVSESGKAELAKVEDGLPFIATKDVGYGRAALVYDNGLKVPLRDPRFKVARANAVLICAEGGSAGRKIGVTNCDVCFGNKLYANEVWEWIHHRYVFYVYQAPTFFKEFAARMTGIIGGIARSEFLSIPFPLPPLAEQKRIVAKVDELMALCDRLEAQQQEREEKHKALSRASLARFADAPTPANLQFIFHPSYTIAPADLRKSILTLAVQCKLVPQDPEDEPAEELLKRLGLKSTVVPHADDSEDDSLPAAWARVRFEDVALVAGGVTLGRKLGDRKTVTLPYLRVANVKRGEIDLTLIKEVSIAEDEIERYALRENDLLMTEGGDWDKVGRAAIWRAEIPVCLHQNHVFRARMRSSELRPFWFERYFNSPVGRGYFESASKQTTNLASINMRQVRSCPIPIPPLAEQRRIVAKVEELMKLVDALETQLAASRATAANLLAALVAELTGTPNTGKASIPASTNTGTGRRGRPPKS